MCDYVRTKQIEAEVQENGIIRNSKGRIIARLVKDVDFDSEYVYESKVDPPKENQKPLDRPEIL